MPFRLPEFYAITAPLEADNSTLPFLDQPACRDWRDRFERLLSGGIRLVQLRAKALQPEQLEDLARYCQDRAAHHGVKLVLNGPAALASSLRMAGVHLTSDALMGLQKRPAGQDPLVSVSCHSPRELAQAQAIGADFACLSPIRSVRGYSARAVLGFDGFAGMISDCRIPVYGLGGLRREDLAEVLRSGGQGVAGISAFWR